MTYREVVLDGLLEVITEERENNGSITAGERILLLEISEDNLQFIEFRYSEWCSYIWTPEQSHRRIDQWADVVRSTQDINDLGLKLHTHLQQNAPRHSPVYVYVIGDMSANERLRSVIEDVFQAPSQSITLHDTPSAFQRNILVLENSLRGRRYLYPFTLELRLAKLIEQDGAWALEEHTVEIFKHGRGFNPLFPLGGYQLFAPVIGDQVILYLREIYEAHNEGNYASEKQLLREQIIWLIPEQHVLDVEIYLDDAALFEKAIDGWRMTIEGTQIADIKPPEIPISPPMIQVKEGFPSVTVMIESTLGQVRHYFPGQAKATSFNVIYDLFEKIINKLTASEVRMLVGFYGDKEGPPPEFVVENANRASRQGGQSGYDARLKSSEDGIPEVQYVPQPRSDVGFLPVDELKVRLTLETFMRHQTASKDWLKSLDRAMWEVGHRINWDTATDRVVIWIGQSPPHVYAPDDKMTHDKRIGFTTDIHFAEELQHTRNRLGIRHYAVFVCQDIPSEQMYDEARQFWEQMDPDLIEVDGSIPNDDFFHDIGRELAQHISNKTRVITLRQGHPRYNKYWAMPNDPSLKAVVFRV